MVFCCFGHSETLSDGKGHINAQLSGDQAALYAGPTDATRLESCAATPKPGATGVGSGVQAGQSGVQAHPAPAIKSSWLTRATGPRELPALSVDDLNLSFGESSDGYALFSFLQGQSGLAQCAITYQLAINGPGTAGAKVHAADEMRAINLQVAWTNAALLTAFGLPSPQHLLRTLAGQQQMHTALAYAMQITLESLVQGTHSGASLLVSLGPSVLLTITPCNITGRASPIVLGVPQSHCAVPQAASPGLLLQYQQDISMPRSLQCNPPSSSPMQHAASFMYPSSAIGAASHPPGSKLAYERTRNAHILHSVPSIVALFDLSGDLLYANPAAAKYFGTVEFPHMGQHPQSANGLGGSGKHSSVLGAYFGLSREQLSEMLEAVVMGELWRGIIQVPDSFEGWQRQPVAANASCANATAAKPGAAPALTPCDPRPSPGLRHFVTAGASVTESIGQHAGAHPRSPLSEQLATPDCGDVRMQGSGLVIDNNGSLRSSPSRSPLHSQQGVQSMTGSAQPSTSKKLSRLRLRSCSESNTPSTVGQQQSQGNADSLAMQMQMQLQLAGVTSASTSSTGQAYFSMLGAEVRQSSAQSATPTSASQLGGGLLPMTSSTSAQLQMPAQLGGSAAQLNATLVSMDFGGPTSLAQALNTLPEVTSAEEYHTEQGLVSEASVGAIQVAADARLTTSSSTQNSARLKNGEGLKQLQAGYAAGPRGASLGRAGALAAGKGQVHPQDGLPYNGSTFSSAGAGANGLFITVAAVDHGLRQPQLSSCELGAAPALQDMTKPSALDMTPFALAGGQFAQKQELPMPAEGMLASKLRMQPQSLLKPYGSGSSHDSPRQNGSLVCKLAGLAKHPNDGDECQDDRCTEGGMHGAVTRSAPDQHTAAMSSKQNSRLMPTSNDGSEVISFMGRDSSSIQSSTRVMHMQFEAVDEIQRQEQELQLQNQQSSQQQVVDADRCSPPGLRATPRTHSLLHQGKHIRVVSSSSSLVSCAPSLALPVPVPNSAGARMLNIPSPSSADYSVDGNVSPHGSLNARSPRRTPFARASAQDLRALLSRSSKTNSMPSGRATAMAAALAANVRADPISRTASFLRHASVSGVRDRDGVTSPRVSFTERASAGAFSPVAGSNSVSGYGRSSRSASFIAGPPLARVQGSCVSAQMAFPPTSADGECGGLPSARGWARNSRKASANGAVCIHLHGEPGSPRCTDASSGTMQPHVASPSKRRSASASASLAGSRQGTCSQGQLPCGHHSPGRTTGVGVINVDNDEDGDGGRSSACPGADDGSHDGVRCWHEVYGSSFVDPILARRVVLLVAHDVSAQQEGQEQLVAMLEAEHQLLENIFPAHVLEHVALRGGMESHLGLRSVLPALKNAPALATRHPPVSILFADIVGFTPMCKALQPAQVMAFLDELFTAFDDLTSIFNVYKVETIGDCYVVAGGLMRVDEGGAVRVRAEEDGEDPLHATKVVQFGKAMLRAAGKMRMPHNREPVKLRVGIHAGPVMSGIVGRKCPRFCLFGDAINTASRMESTCPHGHMQVSDAVHALAPGEPWSCTGGLEVKGRGFMLTYTLSPEAILMPAAATGAAVESNAEHPAALRRSLDAVTANRPPAHAVSLHDMANAVAASGGSSAHSASQQAMAANGITAAAAANNSAPTALGLSMALANSGTAMTAPVVPKASGSSSPSLQS